MSQKKYQAKETFIHRKVAGSDVLISVGENIANFNGYITLNPSAAYIWDTLKEPKTVDEVANALIHEFEVTAEEAAEHTTEFIDDLLEHDMIVSID